jgi:hypothetical protein
MRTVLYCASMIAVTSCMSANARPHMARQYMGAPPTIVCSDRGCTSASAAGPTARTGATRSVRMSRHGSYRTYARRYAHRHEFREVHEFRDVREHETARRQARVEAVEPVHHHGGGVVTIQTAANPITVSANIAGQMRALIADLVAHGYRGHVTCQASGHMPHSLHHTGEACDFAQLSRNRVAAGAGVMYHASSLIAAHGLRDGCSFHDCGHVDSGRNSFRSFRARAQYIPGSVSHIRHYARRYYCHRHFYRTASRRHWH